MKKRSFSLLLCALMILSTSVPALAVNQTEASTTITKTIEEATGGSGDGSGSAENDVPENSSSYEIAIPASFSLDDGEFFEVTASKMELGEKQELHVMVDYDRTFDSDGYFYLANTNNIALRLPCTISKGYPSGVYWETITNEQNASVAVFNSIGGTAPDMFGAVQVMTAGTPAAAGTYSGTIYFNIQVIDY